LIRAYGGRDRLTNDYLFRLGAWFNPHSIITSATLGIADVIDNYPNEKQEANKT
jgi:hypothetical protein